MSIFPVVGVLHVRNSPLVYVQYSMIQHRTAQGRGTVEYSTAVQQYSNTVQYISTVQHSTVQYRSTVQYVLQSYSTARYSVQYATAVLKHRTIPTTQLAKMSIDLKFVKLTADVLEN